MSVCINIIVRVGMYPIITHLRSCSLLYRLSARISVEEKKVKIKNTKRTKLFDMSRYHIFFETTSVLKKKKVFTTNSVKPSLRKSLKGVFIDPTAPYKTH